MLKVMSLNVFSPEHNRSAIYYHLVAKGHCCFRAFCCFLIVHVVETLDSAFFLCGSVACALGLGCVLRWAGCFIYVCVDR